MTPSCYTSKKRAFTRVVDLKVRVGERKEKVKGKKEETFPTPLTRISMFSGRGRGQESNLSLSPQDGRCDAVDFLAVLE